MRTIERACIYLGIAAALAIALGWRGVGQPAVAQNAGGPAAAAEYRVASVDVLTIVEKMIVSDRYKTARESYAAEQNKKLEPVYNELRDMQTKGQKLAPDSPELEPLQRAFSEKQTQLQMSQQEAQIQIEQFNTNQVAEAYRLAVEAARTLATKDGCTHVVATRTGPLSIRSDNIPGAVQEILARPLILGTETNDLTDRLIRQFGLENVKTDDTVVKPPAAER